MSVPETLVCDLPIYDISNVYNVYNEDLITRNKIFQVVPWFIMTERRIT